MNETTMFINRRLEKAEQDCHIAAMEYINIISETGVQRMELEGVICDPYNFQPEKVAKYAAKHLGLDETEVINKYLDLMLLEKMIEFTSEVTA